MSSPATPIHAFGDELASLDATATAEAVRSGELRAHSQHRAAVPQKSSRMEIGSWPRILR